MIAVAAAHWWGPAGWVYRNCPGNLAASGICFVTGFLLGRKAVMRVHSKLDHIIKHHPDIPDYRKETA